MIPGWNKGIVPPMAMGRENEVDILLSFQKWRTKRCRKEDHSCDVMRRRRKRIYKSL